MSARPALDQKVLAQALTQMLAQPPIDFEKLAGRVADIVVERLHNVPVAWTVKQFAARIERSPSYVHNEIREGRLRARPMGGKGHRVIAPADAEAWMTGAKA